MEGPDVGAASERVAVCVVRVECGPPGRRLTVTVTPDVVGPPRPPRHLATTQDALRVVADFLAEPCPPGAAGTRATGPLRRHEGRR